jgi:hypothetical protein
LAENRDYLCTFQGWREISDQITVSEEANHRISLDFGKQITEKLEPLPS